MQAQLTQALTEHDAARILGLSVATLRAWRLKGKGPRFVRFGRAVRYLEADIAHYQQLCAVDATFDRRSASR
ncbi:MAG: helix-turn-helix domain-containing protein [Acidobacteriota bacterium]